jgi:hypothetical protein
MLLLIVQLIILFFITKITLRELFFLLHYLFRSQTLSNIVIAILFFPGTVVHELAHFFMAIIMFLKVRELQLIPEWDHKSIKLGHVTYERKDPVRGFIVGIAPLFAGVAVLFLILLNFPLPASTAGMTLLIGYLIFTISSTMFSSPQDLVDAGVIIPIGLLLYGVSFFFPDIFLAGANYLLTLLKTITPLIASLNLFVTITIIIHLGVIAILWTVRKTILRA